MHFDENKAIEIIRKIMIERGENTTSLAKKMGMHTADLTTVLNEPKDPKKKRRSLTSAKAKKIATFLGYDTVFDMLDAHNTDNAESEGANSRIAKLENELVLVKTLLTGLIEKIDKQSTVTKKN